ncbi:E3 ubiquitin-protein ligase hel2 [Astathelohania contejeani]|uniref:E3 ubiquitin-protein ligase hel2 n=1 Tax=Astathelohania contejeani TaxID=164912 RepID=A0ABQ7HYA3_9MICR|nr:E3 ubiquitin-protein ligase hel2 [Thelohania contejeani]
MDCPICLTTLTYYSATYECTHTLCILCAARLIFLYRQTKCPICKKTVETVRFGDTNREPTKITKEIGIQIQYTSTEVQKQIEELLDWKCKLCMHKFHNKQMLSQHYRTSHSKLMCPECTEHGRHFSKEIAVYTPSSLRQHRRGELDEPGFPGHIFCIFCNEYFYDTELATKHCKQMHELCVHCDRQGRRCRYLRNYTELEGHYIEEHFCCDYARCREKRCFSFTYKSELLEHLAVVHGHDNKTKLGDFIISSKSLDTKKGKIKVMEPLIVKANQENASTKYNDRNINNPIAKDKASINANNNFNKNQNIPFHLNRINYKKELEEEQKRNQLIEKLEPTHSKEIIKIISSFSLNTIGIEETFEQIEMLLGGKPTLKLMKDIQHYFKDKIYLDYLKKYENKIIFPPFKKENKKERVINDRIGFRVFEMGRKK